MSMQCPNCGNADPTNMRVVFTGEYGLRCKSLTADRAVADTNKFAHGTGAFAAMSCDVCGHRWTPQVTVDFE